MAASIADFRLRDVGGSFASLSDPTITAFLEDAAQRLGDDPGRWGTCYNLAQIYLTGHLLSMASYGVVGGPIASATAGGLQVAFGSSGGSRSGSAPTRWQGLLSELALACGLSGPQVIVGRDLPCE